MVQAVAQGHSSCVYVIDYYCKPVAHITGALGLFCPPNTAVYCAVRELYQPLQSHDHMWSL